MIVEPQHRIDGLARHTATLVIAISPWIKAIASTSGAIFDSALVLRAVRAAIEPAGSFDAVSDDSALAVGAGRGYRLDRALEAVEDHGPAIGGHELEGFVVFVAAQVAFRHGVLLVSGAACHPPWLAQPSFSARVRLILTALLRN